MGTVEAGTPSGEVEALPGVIVSDGIHVTRTDRDGHFWLPTDITRSDFVCVSIPSGYEAPVDGDNLPLFWDRIDPTSTSVQTFRFRFTPVDQGAYSLMVFADIHLQGRDPSAESRTDCTSTAPADYVQFREQAVPVARAHAAGKKVPVYGISLGDMTMSNYWNRFTMADYKELVKEIGVPFFHIIGNHDHDLAGSEHEATATYRAHFGPTYYSFNIGNRHFIALDNMDCPNYNNSSATNDGKGYYCRVDEDQLAWMRRDVAALDPSVRDIVLLTHVPLATWSGTRGNVTPVWTTTNGKEVLDILSGYRVEVLSGHYHIAQNFALSETAGQHTLPAACGTYWYTLLCSDGVPAGFTDFQVTQEASTRELVPFGEGYRDRTRYQVYSSGVTTQTGTNDFRSHPSGIPDETAGYRKAVLVNLYGWEPGWSVSVVEGSRAGRTGEMVWRVDPEVRDRFYDKTVNYKSCSWLNSTKTYHMFLYTPEDPSQTVTMQVKDASGKTMFIIPNIQIHD